VSPVKQRTGNQANQTTGNQANKEHQPSKTNNINQEKQRTPGKQNKQQHPSKTKNRQLVCVIYGCLLFAWLLLFVLLGCCVVCFAWCCLF
jgi:Flp pilus assembly protein TadB